jgi:glutamyl-tRNA synthetase
MDKVVTRFPPSPTGEIHIGNMRTMLFNYLYAKHFGGDVFLRFEDTDLERSKKEYEPIIINGLKTLGLNFDYGPFRQSERSNLYKEKLLELIKKGLAYEAEESNSGNGNVIRYKNPNKVVTFNDKIRGNISIESSIFGDFIIARNINNPIYHFAVVVDDMDMGVTHIIRGEDHITSTPRQILLLEALGGKIPLYAHLPLIVGSDNKKLSKRHGATSVSGFLEQGYLPTAIVNYLAFLGWNPGGEREIYSMDELIEIFSLEKVGKNPAQFSYDKLNDINYQYMLKLSDEDYRNNIYKFLDETYLKLFTSNQDISEKIINVVLKTRVKKFSDVSTLISSGDLDYFFKKPHLDCGMVCFKSNTLEATKKYVGKTRDSIGKIPNEDWDIESIKTELSLICSECGTGNILHPLRVILSGKKQSPDPFILSYVLGKKEVLERIDSFLG